MRVSILTTLAAALLGVGTASGQEAVDFTRDIRPILADRCFLCHGPDGGRRKAKLRLDTAAGAFAEREGGAAIVPGDAAASALVRRIEHASLRKRMPPADSGKSLDAHERSLLIRWIDAGAPWRGHWSFAPLAEEEPPVAVEASWGASGVDRFICARLAQEGMTPASQADRHTLIRRVSLDLTGLPPTPAEVDAFVADETAGAYERVVDRLLGSPRYGEHMARFWLDAARYGDTHGLHLDNYREMWPYRDWVVAAFNANMSFDQFTVEQLAGDLLPDATLSQQIASGFNRCHVSTNEGGSIEEEVYVRNVIDRISTVGTVFLGLSVGCAVCHDHKFDPISQGDFYSLFAFFNSIDGKPMDGNAKSHAPVVRVPSPAQVAEVAVLEAARDVAEQAVTVALATVDYVEPDSAEVEVAGQRCEVVWIDDELPAGAEAAGDDLEWVEAPTAPVRSGRRSMRRKSRGNQQHAFGNADRKLRIGDGDVLFAWVYLDPTDPPREIMLQWNGDGDADWAHGAFWGEDLIGYGKSGTMSRRRLGDLPEVGVWVRLEVPAAEVGLAPGWAVHGMTFTQFDGTSYWDAVGLVTATEQEPEDLVWIDDDVPTGAVLGGDGDTWSWVNGEQFPMLSGSRCLRRAGGDGLNQDFFTGAPRLRLQAGDRLFAHVWLSADDPPKSVQLQFHRGDWNHRARWGAPAHGPGAAGGGDFVAGELPATGQWVRLEVGLEQVGLKPGQQLDGWAFTQVGGTVYWDRAGILSWGAVDERPLLSLRAWERHAVADAAVSADVRKALEVDVGARSVEQQQLVRDHYLRHVYRGTRTLFAPLEARVREVAEQLAVVEKATPTTLVMVELAEPRPAYVLLRGHYDAQGDRVERVTPQALPPMAPDLPRDRLGLARWLVSPTHPLTARVAVNRLWQQVFGVGLVKTAEDFGSQGEPPSHPALLDWLAARFITEDWDVKRMMRRLVLSATYRQSSKVTADGQLRDPANRLLGRGRRFRLDAETLRDQALFVSGLLVEKLGGPGVKPPQPEGLWQAVAYVGSNTSRFEADTGPDKVWRRSLYTFWKRTAPSPQMTTFDAPSREACTVRRERTNTPLQALLLMNEPQYVEAARHLAGRALRAGGGSDATRAGHLIYLVLGRPATGADVADLVALLGSERAAFVADPGAARALVAVGAAPADATLDPVELAAWTMVASTVLNLHEAITSGD